MDEDQIKVRIQFINDLDPFVSTSNREPLKPLQYYLPLHSQIAEHLPEICRQLRAPHKVSFRFFSMTFSRPKICLFWPKICQILDNLGSVFFVTKLFGFQPGDAALQVSPSASGDLGSYLDSDLSISEQPDELQILSADP